MKLAVTLVHNKSDQENEAQIASALSLVNRIQTLIQDPVIDPGTSQQVLDKEGNPLFNEVPLYHYEFKDVSIPHQVKFYQVVPFGVLPPPNFYEIDSHNVLYGLGDEDKVNDHPRFFNWGLKRGTDYGAEATVYLENPQKFDPQAIDVYLNSLVDPHDKHELAEDEAVKVASLAFLKQVGQLDESKPFLEAITEVKGRTREKGLKVA